MVSKSLGNTPGIKHTTRYVILFFICISYSRNSFKMMDLFSSYTNEYKSYYMNDIDDIQSSPPALLPPNTSFTPHIQTLVDYYKSNYEYCQSQDVTAMKGYGIQITVPPPSTDNNHQPIVMNEINRGSKIRLKKWLLQSVLPRHGNILPPGDITIAFSVADRANNETKKTKKRIPKCQFSSSAHKGQNSVYNFQDMYNLVNNVAYPKALPWKERDPIPVFRGSYWGVPLSTNKLNKLATMELEQLMNNDGYNKSAAHDIVKETYFHRLLNNEDQVYGRNNSRYQRLNLVYTSIQYPTLGK